MQLPMLRRRACMVLVTVAVLTLGGVPASFAQTPGEDTLAPVSGTLKTLLSTVTGAAPVTTLVHGTDVSAARRAVQQAGLREVTSFDRIGVVAARGSAEQVRTARTLAGVTYLENNDPLQAHASSGTAASRSASARTSLTGADGTALNGKGVSVAVIDSGVDPNHPAFRGEDGSSRVVRNLKSLCLDGTATGCVKDVPTWVDTDTLSLGGHGTHVTGIAAGNDMTLSDGTRVGGSAPGSKIVPISAGAAIVLLSTDSALNWVLEHHNAPCGNGVPASVCPPIKVINNSYGPQGGGAFDPNSATVKLQRELAKEGVLTVWANGNDGGDGSQNHSNPPAQDPTAGVLSVASYNDEGSGTRDGKVSSYSSRGAANEPATWPDFSAPGQNILSACRPYLIICSQGLQPKDGPGPLDIGTYNVISGTSMAAPQVTGIVAQLFQAKPDASPSEIEGALKTTAHKYSDGADYQPHNGYTSSFDKGAGLVDTVAAATKLGATPTRE